MYIHILLYFYTDFFFFFFTQLCQLPFPFPDPIRLANNKVMREINTDSEDYKYKI